MIHGRDMEKQQQARLGYPKNKGQQREKNIQ